MRHGFCDSVWSHWRFAKLLAFLLTSGFSGCTRVHAVIPAQKGSENESLWFSQPCCPLMQWLLVSRGRPGSLRTRSSWQPEGDLRRYFPLATKRASALASRGGCRLLLCSLLSLLAQLQDPLWITACFFACHVTHSIYCTVCIQSIGSRPTGELRQNTFCKVKA